VIFGEAEGVLPFFGWLLRSSFFSCFLPSSSPHSFPSFSSFLSSSPPSLALSQQASSVLVPPVLLRSCHEERPLVANGRILLSSPFRRHISNIPPTQNRPCGELRCWAHGYGFAWNTRGLPRSLVPSWSSNLTTKSKPALGTYDYASFLSALALMEHTWLWDLLVGMDGHLSRMSKLTERLNQ